MSIKKLTGSEISADYAALEQALWNAGFKPVRLIEKMKIGDEVTYSDRVYALEIHGADYHDSNKAERFLNETKMGNGYSFRNRFYASLDTNRQRITFLIDPLSREDSDKD